ncbi:unnamed protein product [Rodentolepis nana]|uniref:Peptidase S1 domain-containing protein n=1 Tax=Rodentolepis nana TaxID=102285 RepID=A0A0R3U0P5_RODNA|nr:unnamed protein product [Rodentolepis nana]
MLLNRPTLLLIALVSLGVGDIVATPMETTTASSQEASSSEPQNNVSCGEYFDQFCEVKDAQNPHCLYRKDTLDEEYRKMGKWKSYMSPEIHKHCKICGTRRTYQRKPIINKIYGGIEAMPHSWPWMAGLYESVPLRRDLDVPVQRRTYSKIICGATLISQKHAITATHCLLGENYGKVLMKKQWYPINETAHKKLFLRFGDHHRNDWPFEPQLDIYIRRFMISRSNRYVLNGGLAILELERPLNFSKF